MFLVGAKIVYPMHGAGIIDSIEDKKVFGQIKKCYIIKLIKGDIKIIIPINEIESIGLRLISEYWEYEKALDILGGPPIEMHEKWNIRYRENQIKIKKGEILDLAIIVNYLSNMEKIKRISTWEKKMLDETMEILVSELSLIANIKFTEMKKTVDEILNVC